MVCLFNGSSCWFFSKTIDFALPVALPPCAFCLPWILALLTDGGVRNQEGGSSNPSLIMTRSYQRGAVDIRFVKQVSFERTVHRVAIIVQKLSDASLTHAAAA